MISARFFQHSLLTLGLAAASPLSSAAPLVSYNDTSKGGTITASTAGANVTNFDAVTDTTGTLVDYTTGVSFATVTYQVTKGTVTTLNNGVAALVSGSDAEAVFGNIVDVRGTYSGSSDVNGEREFTMTFSGLDTTKVYEIALLTSRSNTSAQGNTSSISGAASFVNSSTDAIDPNSASNFVVYGQGSEKISHFTSIDPGADGQFVITIAGGSSGAHLSAFRLTQVVPEPASLTLVATGLMLVASRRARRAISVE